jgi:hypothetical protein
LRINSWGFREAIAAIVAVNLVSSSNQSLRSVELTTSANHPASGKQSFLVPQLPSLQQRQSIDNSFAHPQRAETSSLKIWQDGCL